MKTPTVVMQVALAAQEKQVASGVVKLYRVEKARWYEVADGLLIWSLNQRSGVQHFKLVDIQSGEVKLNEELYENFELNYKAERTSRGTHHFHIMEFEDIMGVCFAHEADAMEFAKKVPIMAPKPTKKADSKEARKAEAEREKREEKERKEKEKARKEKDKLERKQAKEREKRERKKGDVAGGDKEMIISAPTNFKHITHIGWDEVSTVLPCECTQHELESIILSPCTACELTYAWH